jgi:hypothetical protein
VFVAIGTHAVELPELCTKEPSLFPCTLVLKHRDAVSCSLQPTLLHDLLTPACMGVHNVQLPTRFAACFDVCKFLGHCLEVPPMCPLLHADSRFHNAGQLAAKHACIIAYWAHRAGASGPIKDLARKPGLQSGKYSQHFDKVLNSKPEECYNGQGVPTTSACDVSKHCIRTQVAYGILALVLHGCKCCLSWGCFAIHLASLCCCVAPCPLRNMLSIVPMG